MVLSTEVLLSVSRISKSFGGAKALNDVSVDFRAGEVHALLEKTVPERAPWSK